ncbi:MAG: hemerythrin domain-containing protein [Dehalococcoidia bacterium]|nr:hemerythrin domain-containing protein [Dehalococcoidia bacterium]
MEAPVRKIRYIHKAIRKELDRLEQEALALNPNDREALDRLAERHAFLQMVVRAHSDGEDEVMFPELETKVPNVTEPYVLDHRAKDEAFETVGRLIGELREASSEQRRSELLWGIQRGFIALNTDLVNHFRKEELHLVPLVEQNFGFEEQGETVRRSLEHYPREQMPRIFGWMINALDPDERADQLQTVMRTLPPQALAPAFEEARKLIGPDAWRELQRRIPDLAA